MGTCIGKRNYKYFVSFVFCATSYALYASILSFYRYSQIAKTQKNKLSGFEAFGMGIFASILLILIGNLFFWHVQLIMTNTTTNEFLKRKFDSMNPNPNNKGFSQNCKAFFCLKKGPSRIVRNPTNSHHYVPASLDSV